MNHPAVENCNYLAWNWNRTACRHMNYVTKVGLCCGRTKKTLCPWRNKDVNKTVRQTEDAPVQDTVV